MLPRMFIENHCCLLAIQFTTFLLISQPKSIDGFSKTTTSLATEPPPKSLLAAESIDGQPITKARFWSKPTTLSTNKTTTTTTTTTTSTTTTTTTTTTTMTPRPKPQKCRDTDMNCPLWVARNASECEEEDRELLKYCRLSCRICGNFTVEVPEVDERYDVRKVPPNLHKLAFLIGRWKSDFGGKADFPTIPKFTYGEELDFSLATRMNIPVLNYTAFAWDNSDAMNTTELHSENGFLAGSPNSSLVSLNTVMSNGFVTIEEGEETENSIRFELQRIGRINFSRDLPVRRIIREWILLNATHLESRLHMSTLTHRMLLHTHIIYYKVYPL